jgi:hypothetical protein
MTEQITVPTPFFKMIKKVAFFYVHVFKKIFWLVVLASLLQAVVPALIPEEPTVGLAVNILSALVLMFFYAWILARADSLLLGRVTETIQDALQVAKKRFLSILGALVVYLVLAFAIVLLGIALHRLGTLWNIDFLMLLILAAIGIFFYILFFFSIPSIVLDRLPVLRGFEYSARIVRGHWWRTFGIIIIFIIPLIVLSLSILLLPTRNLGVITLYEFIFHIIMYPLVVSITLVLYHDLKSRRQMQMFKHVSEV